MLFYYFGQVQSTPDYISELNLTMNDRTELYQLATPTRIINLLQTHFSPFPAY